MASPWLGRLGGRVTLDSPHGIAVAAGSLIDVSSGGAVLHRGETRAGKGGDVTLRAGAPEVEGATARAGGQLRGHGMAGGGTLTLETDGKVVIGAADALARQTHTQVGAQQPQPLLLDPSLLGAGFATSTAVTACGWPRARRWTWRCRCTDTSRATRPRASGRRRRCWRRYTRRTRSGRADAARRAT